MSMLNIPLLQRGAIIGLDPSNPIATVIRFQYNPSTMSRSLSPSAGNGDSGNQKPRLIAGPPAESISLEVDINAADQLESDDFPANTFGIYPQLSALEMLLYPKALELLIKQKLYRMGAKELYAAPAPLTLFVWGFKRVLPVKVTSFSINEEAYDSDLNPIMAKVSLTLQVLTYQDFSMKNLGFHLSVINQLFKESMGVINTIKNTF